MDGRERRRRTREEVGFVVNAAPSSLSLVGTSSARWPAACTNALSIDARRAVSSRHADAPSRACSFRMFRGPSSSPTCGFAPTPIFLVPTGSHVSASSLRVDSFAGDRRLLRARGRVGEGFFYAPVTVHLNQAAPEDQLARLGGVLREHGAAIGQTVLLSGYFRFFRVAFGPAQIALLAAPLLFSAVQAILGARFGGGADGMDAGGVGEGPLTRSRDGGGGGGGRNGGGGKDPADVARALEVISERIRAIEEWALKQEEIDGEFARRQVELLNAKLAPIHESYAVLEDRVEPLREEVARLAEAVERSNAALGPEAEEGRLGAQLDALDVPRRGEVKALEAKMAVLVDAVKSVTAQQGALAAQMTDLAAALQGVVAQASSSPRTPSADSPGAAPEALARVEQQLRRLAEAQEATALRFDALDVDMRGLLTEQRAAADRLAVLEAEMEQIAGPGAAARRSLPAVNEEEDLREWIRSIEQRLFYREGGGPEEAPEGGVAEADEHEEFEGTFGEGAAPSASPAPAAPASPAVSGRLSTTGPASPAPGTPGSPPSAPEFPYATRGSSSPSSDPPAALAGVAALAGAAGGQRLSLRDVAYGFDRNPFVVGAPRDADSDDVWAPTSSAAPRRPPAPRGRPGARGRRGGGGAGRGEEGRGGWTSQIAGFFSTVAEAVGEPDRALERDVTLQSYGSPLEGPRSPRPPAPARAPATGVGEPGGDEEEAAAARAERAAALTERALELVAAAKRAGREWGAGEGAGRDAQSREAARAEADALYEEAFDLLERSVNLVPGSREALWYWGTALLAQSKIKKTDEEKERVLLEAGGHYRALIVLDPRNVRALFNWGLALCYRARLRPEGGKDADSFYGAAVEKFQRALVYEPGMKEALSNLGLALYNMAQGRRAMAGAARASVPSLLERAEATFQEALAADPEDTMARNGVQLCKEGLRAWRRGEVARKQSAAASAGPAAGEDEAEEAGTGGAAS
eukprot:tig00020556_g11000.t1